MSTLMNKRIFIVDDDPFWTIILQRMLTDIGYTNIVKFSNGTECVNNLHLNPGLIFLDYQMEDMNGLEALQKIKDYFPGIGVIFCTAHEDLNIAVSAIKQGSFDYVLKSNANKKDIASIIESLTNSAELADKIF
jgi:DNA-binding NtrC family response regulator